MTRRMGGRSFANLGTEGSDPLSLRTGIHGVGVGRTGSKWSDPQGLGFFGRMAGMAIAGTGATDWREIMQVMKWGGVVVLGMIAAVAGCGGEDAGTAPVIANLTVMPAMVPVGTETII